MALGDDLAEWTSRDWAAYALGRALGLFSEGDFHLTHKHVFWTDNPVGQALHESLLALARAGVLEQRDEPDTEFRWRGPAGQ